ncbi:hypothetical protein SUDANB95_05516 [Actinosynnema sp. ALI-1.44]
MARVYATEADLIAYGAPPGTVLPTGPEATRQLTRASARVDELLLTALYTTDTNGMPTKAAVVQALKDATCAQVVWWATGAGDETGAASRWTDVGIGSLKLSSKSAVGGDSSQRYAPDAVAHLRSAGADIVLGAVGTT